MSTLEIIKNLCEANNTSLKALEEKLHFSNGSLAKVKVIPSDRLFLIAQNFGVSMEYLMTGDETKKEPTSISESELTPVELSIIELLRQIPAERQAAVRLAFEISLRSQGVLESPSEQPPQDR